MYPNKAQVMETVRSVDWNASIDFIYQDEPKGSKFIIGDNSWVKI